MSDTPTLTTRDEWLILIGYEAGREDGEAVTVILQDLIAELRDEHRNEGYCGAALAAADRAEARLREVRDE